MSVSTIFRNLHLYDKIIIYGAGAVGQTTKQWLKSIEIDRGKIFIWDIRYDTISKRYDIPISKPDFTFVSDSQKTIVIIALAEGKHSALISELKQKFYSAGYKNVFVADALIRKDSITNVFIDDFKNNAYLDCAYQDDIDFSNYTAPVKAIAFYLPQFHEIPENNEWWGEGFTEWTNTKKAKPNFKGHYQPREPHDDLGYYDLSDIDTIRKQADMAKRHGIYGWCMYYYWFSGKKLLTQPIDLLVEHKDIDINFCLMWCNETWTKRWSGDNVSVLLDNYYAKEDSVSFISDLKKYTDDTRYIKHDGKPLILIYQVQDIPDVKALVKSWRKHAIDVGIGEIAVFSVIHPWSIRHIDLDGCFDAETEFNSWRYATKAIRLVDKTNKPISNSLYYYQSLIENYINATETNENLTYLSCFCGFDNTPRYGQRAHITDLGFSLELFYRLVKHITNNAVKYKKDYIFVFAWNEWAESAYLEPDKRFGYAMINTFSKALLGQKL